MSWIFHFSGLFLIIPLHLSLSLPLFLFSSIMPMCGSKTEWLTFLCKRNIAYGWYLGQLKGLKQTLISNRMVFTVLLKKGI